jgi:hypothetical protein
MTANEKNIEGLKPQKTGDHQVAGTPITNAEDNAHQQRQEKLTAAKAFRFTAGDAAPFTIDMGNGEKVQDKRPPRDTTDGHGHVTEKNYSDGRHTHIHYDKNGQPDEIKTPDGQSYKKHVGKDGKPDGTWDVTVPKDKSPDGKEHHYNAKIDIKVDGDGTVSWTTKAGEHSKIDRDGKWHKDVVKEDSDALHTDLQKRDMGESTKKMCEQVNKSGNAEDVYNKLCKEHPEDRDKVHLVHKFENGKMVTELAPGPDPMDGVVKDGRTAQEAKDLDTALGTRDMGVSAQKRLDEINKNGDSKGVYDRLSDSDKKMVHLETVDGKDVLKLGPDPNDGVLKQVRAEVEAKELDTALGTRDLGVSAQKKVDEINAHGDGKAVYDKLSDADKKMVHLELVDGKEVLKLGEAPPVFIDGKAENFGKPGDTQAPDAHAEAGKIKAMMDNVVNHDGDPKEAIREMRAFARTHASQFEAMCNELKAMDPGHFHVDKDQKTGEFHVSYGGNKFFGIPGTPLYDGKPGATGNDPQELRAQEVTN